MAYDISLKIPRRIEVMNSDLVILAKQDGNILGTLTISKGTVDWRPKNKKSGRKNETNLNWSQFAEVMEKANRK